ncbi:transcription factor bHLH53 [Nicotiana tabacum]|uniref:Transcription factor bHLH52 n=2 Tax=Nicotiana TaxID=4085 RepID=A0A1S4BWD8_TOBAC|nr:PREDICTED: transcription factor bHLH52-like [Nicotiana tabacum]
MTVDDQLLLGFKDESFPILDRSTCFLEPLYNSNDLFLPQVKIFQDNNYFNGFVPMLPEFESLPVYKSENGLGTKESSKCNEKNLSAQSIAARQRRKKITEKTHELGKLIPGGKKMNTAVMFQAAYKYINFLQAQVGILQFMASYQEERELFQTPQICWISINSGEVVFQ